MVCAVEQAAGVEAACEELRLDIELPGALRWLRRRVQAVHASLHLLKGLLPELFAPLPTTLTAFAERLGVGAVLRALRQIGAAFLQQLPAPLGFAPRPQAGSGAKSARQHRVGADPPGAVA